MSVLRNKYRSPYAQMLVRWRKDFQRLGLPSRSKILKAVVIDENPPLELQNDPLVTLPQGSVQARIPGIDFDVQDKNLRYFVPQSNHSVEGLIKGQIIYVTFPDEDILSNGIILGKLCDEQHPNGIVIKNDESQWSDQMLMGSIITNIPTTNPIFYYNGLFEAGSDQGNLPSKWPILNYTGNRNYEYTSTGIKIFINKSKSFNIVSAGGGIIETITNNSIIINHGKIFNNEDVITTYSNLISNSYQSFEGIEEGSYIDERISIGKGTTPYIHFEMMIGNQFVDAIKYIGSDDKELKKPKLNQITQNTYFEPIPQII